MQLSTTVAPAKTFTVDEVPYELLGMDHLSPEAEAYVMATFTRYGALAEKLETIDDVEKSTALALRMRTMRMDVLEKMTTCPRDVLEKIPMSGQVVMMNALRTELDATTGDEDEDGDDVKEDGGEE